MQIEYLKYIGNKDSGNIVVRAERLNSPWRFLEYNKGKKLRIGREIPTRIAEHVARRHKDLFTIEKLDLDTNDSFKVLLTDLYEDFHGDVSKIDAQNIAMEVFNIDIKPKEKQPEKTLLKRKKRN